MRKFLSEYILTIIFILLIFIFAGIIVFFILTTSRQETGEIRAGAVFINSIEDGGWSQRHYEGLNVVCKDFHIPLNIVQYVDETPEATEAAVHTLVQKGCNIIFLTSDGFDNSVREICEKHNQVKFYTISDEADADNVTTYFARMYQVRYLTGIIAGSMTKSNILGYVAGADTPQVDRGINAYLLGARSVNPDAVVKVRFIDSWRNDDSERNITQKLIEEDNADVIAYHTSNDNAIDIAEQYGVYSIGYVNSEKERSEKYLCSAVYDWSPVYREIISDYLKGNSANRDYYWFGVLYGAVGIEKISPLIPDEALEKVDEELDELVNGDDVFVNEIYRNDGKQMCFKGERISDKALLRNMNWFVEGVEIYE